MDAPLPWIWAVLTARPIDTKLQMTVTGIWTARVRFNGVWLIQEVEAMVGESIILVNDYPEEILLTPQLIQPNGTVLPGGPFSFKQNNDSRMKIFLVLTLAFWLATAGATFTLMDKHTAW